MLVYIIKRFLFLILTLLGIITLVFFVSRVIPGDPAIVIAGPKATLEQIEIIRHEYGFDRPVVVQYAIYMKNLLLHGDLGLSVYARRPVSIEIIERFPATLELVVVSMVFAIIFGIILGIITAVWRNQVLDYILRSVTIGGISLPAFWLGILVQLIFFYKLGIFPSTGRITAVPPPHITGLYLIDSLIVGNFQKFTDALVHLILPAFTLSLGFLAQIARITRSSMLEVLHEQYAITARSLGFSENVVIFKYVLRNALIPIITAIGMYTGLALGGSVVIESVFAWRGIGEFMYQGVINSDFNAIVGVTLVFAAGYLIINFIIDLLYPVVNPRIKLE